MRPRPVWSIQLHVKVKQFGMIYYLIIITQASWNNKRWIIDDDDAFFASKIFIITRYEHQQNRTQSEVITLEEQRIDLRPRDQNIRDRDQDFVRPRPSPRPVTVRMRPRPKKWPRDHAVLDTPDIIIVHKAHKNNAHLTSWQMTNSITQAHHE